MSATKKQIMLDEAKETLEKLNDAELEARLALQAAQKAYDKAIAQRELAIQRLLILVDNLG